LHDQNNKVSKTVKSAEILMGYLFVMGPSQKCLTLVRSAIFGLGLGLENYPKNPNFFPSSKKIGLDRVKKYPGQRWVVLLFTASQWYARVRAHHYYLHK